MNVTWSAVDGAGSLSSEGTSTDADGYAATVWTLGTTAGTQKATVSVAELDPVTLTATAQAGSVDGVALDPAETTVGAGDSMTIAVTIADRYGNEVSGITPQWSTTDETVAAVDSTGRVAARSAGTVTIRAEAGGAADSADITVSQTQPRITSIAPDTVLPGHTMVIEGVAFSATADDNSVTISGQSAAVTEATPTRLTVQVPQREALPCGADPLPVKVTVGGMTGSESWPFLVATPVTLDIGQSAVIDNPADLGCSALMGTGSRRYTLSVVNGASVPSANASVQLESFPETASTAPRQRQALSSPVSPLSARSGGRSTVHIEKLEESRRLYQRLGARRHHKSPRRAMRTAAVGDTVPILYGGCFSPDTIQGRVVHVGARSRVMEDIAAPQAGEHDGHLQDVGVAFDTLMYNVLANNLGDPLAYNDQLQGTGKVSMIFTPKVNEEGGVLGFVQAKDFEPRSACPGSNEREIFYSIVPDGTNYRLEDWLGLVEQTAIHEVKHIASFAEKFAQDAQNLEVIWLEEGTAVTAEELYGRHFFDYSQHSNATYAESGIECAESSATECADKPNSVDYAFTKLGIYMFEVDSIPLVYTQGYGSGWGLTRWAADHTDTPEGEFFRAIVKETQKIGIENIEARTGREFADLMTGWATAMAVDDYMGITPAREEFTVPSWNLRDVYDGHFGFYPLPVTQASFNESFESDIRSMPGGTALYVELSGSKEALQVLRITDGNGAPVSDQIRLSIVRVE